MKCQECVKEGKKSTITISGQVTTLMAINSYYDEEGNYHIDNPNTTTTSYTCSNGHSWERKE